MNIHEIVWDDRCGHSDCLLPLGPRPVTVITGNAHLHRFCDMECVGRCEDAMRAVIPEHRKSGHRSIEQTMLALRLVERAGMAGGTYPATPSASTRSPKRRTPTRGAAQ